MKCQIISRSREISQLSIGEFSYYILTSYLQKIVCSAIKASDSALSFIASREKDSSWFYLSGSKRVFPATLTLTERVYK